MTLKICIAQLNLVVGDLSGNADKIIASARKAYAQGARLVLTPELAICGYAAEDLFLRPSFIAACDDAIKFLAFELSDLKDLCLVVGHPIGGGERTRSVAIQQRFNSASVLSEGRIIATYSKRELPNYQVFDERRYFSAGNDVCVFEAGTKSNRVKIGLLICEDAWFETPCRETALAGAEILAVINASPFHIGKGDEREVQMRQRVRECKVPLLYGHLIGGQDEVIFEGRSFALDSQGEVVARSPAFVEDLLFLDISKKTIGLSLSGQICVPEDDDAELWGALVLGVRDYVDKNHFPSVVLGLSGGIDSALVLAIAVDALGPNRVKAVMMPSPYTADISWIDARDMAKRLGVDYQEISIEPEFIAFKTSLLDNFRGLDEDATEENIQARIRGTLLMALSNKFGSIVLTTGNKSEMATGYCTLYGDMAGGFAAIKDLTKTTVFRLARWRNEHDPFETGRMPIPDRIITRPPSAELRHEQTDQDSLPEYDVLDQIVNRYMENDESIKSIIEAGFDKVDVEKVTKLIRVNEYKRRQSPIGIRVTHRGFGKDWRYPITNRFRA